MERILQPFFEGNLCSNGYRTEKHGALEVINHADKYCCSGWTVDILIRLSLQLSCTFILYFQAEGIYGVYDNVTGSWNGVVQDLITGKGDIAVDLALVSNRCMVVDCSLGYLFDGFNAIVKLGMSAQEMENTENDRFRSLLKNFQIFVSPLHIDLLITVVIIFNVFLVFIWAADKICLSFRNRNVGRKKETFSLLESFSYVWATAFGRDVGDSKKPITLSARYLASWLAFLSLVFVNVYVARLMAEIVKQKESKPFTSLQDPRIVKRGLKLGVVRGSAMEAYFHKTHNVVLKKIFEENMKNNVLPSLKEGIEQVKNGTIHGFIADTLSLETNINRDPNCSLSLMGRDFFTVPVGFLFRKNWPWAEKFKLMQLRMNEDKRFEDEWKMKRRQSSCQTRRSDMHTRLSVADMSGVFLILIFTFAYCCFCLFFENTYQLLKHYYVNFKKSWKIPQRARQVKHNATNVD
ncbi:glutamate receptor ionotropic, NMDA 1-like [Xenia sp. Carnegie-2017]|uniref:glutamate receptor ionotropic, NMDA 1-like n=1 Tax=Xenia sp. Carnegie-2017 TaxID=2897299 RepID=UPI001F039FA9|nr:glutamate receptor ionotropic, NMDA 1-like [Xenia sp. Carnegie-2017]